MKTISFLLFMLAGLTTFAQNKSSGLPQIKTANGVLEGVVEESGIHSFKGIPFAQAPVGDLRWKEPQAPKNWTGIRKADKFGPQAMQRAIYSDMIFRSDGKSEDCLYLNVWTPAKSATEKLPVLVYFYGGGFSAGDGSELRYDGESMSKKGIVAITVNYRLGIFGFMAHPDLTKESAHHSSGNYGFMDQHAALVWVQKNIAAFGGDPKKVTIAGESAGSMSVSAQVASPLSKGLFTAAIAESGAVLGNLAPTPLADAEKSGIQFATKAGAASLADLRNIPADKLLELSATSRFPTAIDGYFLPESPDAIFASGKQMDISLLIGWNSAESGARSVLGKEELTVDGYKNSIKRLYPEKAEEVLAAYAPATNADVEQVATDLASDRFIAFATWKFADLHSKTKKKPVYRYFFTRKRPPIIGGDGSGPFGAVHASEIEYAMGNLSTNKFYNWTPEDYKVSETMQNYFANFIKTGNPNGMGLPNWESLTSANAKVMVIDVDAKLEPEKNKNRYVLMDSFYKK